MKKLISLLSFLTISGATMPMVVAAAPYQQTNNLEVLSRVKRTNNNIREIPTSSSELNINEEFSQVDFYNTITEIRNWLRNQNILLLTSTNSDGSTTNPYAINTDLQNNNNNNFIIPVSFQNRRINLVFRSRDLYLQGYTMIGNNNNIYYHFNDSTTTNINGYTSWRLGFDGNYNSLLPSEEYIRWNDILASFNDLINYSEDTTTARSIRRSLGRIIILTAESLRFNSVQSLIDNNFRLEQERPERPIYWNPGSNEILNSSKEPNVNFIVTNWLTNSNLFYSNNIMNRDFNQNLGNQIAILVVSAGVQFLRDWCEKFPNSMPKKRNKRNINDNLLCSKYEKQGLGTFIINNSLGSLNNNNKDTILAAVKAKNTNLDINDVGVSQITDTSADIDGATYYDSNKYQGYKTVYFTVKQDLLTDFKWCIDPVNDTNDETILAAVKAKNPNLDTSQVYVKQKVVNGRLELGIKSTSNKYNTTSSGHCDNFTVRQNISNIITNTQLGSLNNNNKDTILNAVKTKNPNLDTSQVGVSRITDTSADIDGATYYNSNKYQGYKTVYFTNKKCSFKEIFLTPVWDNWYRLIPGYDAYHAIECI